MEILWSAVAGAWLLGFRHGFDWDHVAAIADITSAQDDRRRAFGLATLYMAGHALVVVVLGLAAVAAGSSIPAWLDGLMGRIVGLTLVALGVYVLWSLARFGREARLRSRWMLVVAGVRRAAAWWRAWRRPEVVIEHEHDHPVGEVHGTPGPTATAVARGRGVGRSPVAVAVAAPTHRHRHVHRAPMPDDPFATYSRGTAFGVGMLHGVGVETPTQVLLFATAAGVGGLAAGSSVVLAFVVGLFVGNAVVAACAGAGLAGASRSFPLYAALAVTVALLSMALGVVYLLELPLELPALA